MPKPAWLSFEVGISLREALLTIGCALVGAAAFPPIGLWPCSLVSIVLFLALIRDRNGTQARSVGLLYGFCYGLGTMYWLFGLFGVVAISLSVDGRLLWLTGTLITDGTAVVAAAHRVVCGCSGMAAGDAWYLRFRYMALALGASPAG